MHDVTLSAFLSLALLGGCAGSPRPPRAEPPPASEPLRATATSGALRARALAGPRPTLEALCRDVVQGLPTEPGNQPRCAADGEGIEQGPRAVASALSPVVALKMISITAGDGFTYCALAVETTSGWYADLPDGRQTALCGNVGTERISIESKELAVLPSGQDAPPIVVLRFVQTTAHQGEDRRRELEIGLFCATAPGAPPRCLEVQQRDGAGTLTGELRDEGSLTTELGPGGVLTVREKSGKNKMTPSRQRYVESVVGAHRLASWSSPRL